MSDHQDEHARSRCSEADRGWWWYGYSRGGRNPRGGEAAGGRSKGSELRDEYILQARGVAAGTARGNRMGAASYQRRVMAALAVPPKLERPVLPGPGVVRLVDPALGVFLSQFQQARRELAGEEQVAEELAPGRVSPGADQPAEQVEIN
jgi:hypothetical protein